MKGKLKKINGKWFVEYTGVSYSGGNPKQLGSYTKKMQTKTLPLLMDSSTFPKDRSDFVIDSRVDFKEVLVNTMGREVDPNNLGQNHSECVWYAKLSLVEKEEPKKVLTEEDIWSKEDIDVVTDYINKEQQKQHLIDMMKGDEELGLYDESSPLYNHQVRLVNDLAKKIKLEQESREIKLEDVFNDEKREGAKRVIHQHKVLKGLSLVNPAHLEMTDNGHGEFPDGYKLTEKGIQYIIEQLNK
jgi:organic radical activating enzyme